MSTRAKSKSPGPERTEERRGLLRDARSRLRHELDEIRAAQGRLETGSFSVCEVCRRPIPVPRLRAVAWARACVTCRSQDERR